MLVSDAERDRVVARLGDETVAGRLTVNELEARVAAALSARTHRDLARAQRGLPGDRPVLRLSIRLVAAIAIAVWLLTVLVAVVLLTVARFLLAQRRNPASRALPRS